jgi:hypothetical protein
MTIQGKHNGIAKDIEATDDGELIVRAITEEEIEHASSKGNAFSFHVTSAAIDSTDTVLFVRNDDATLLVLDRCTLNADLVETMTWQICLGSTITTPSGGALSPVNLYPTFASKSFSHISLTDETAVAQGSIIEEHTIVMAPTEKQTLPLLVPLHGIILGKGQYVQFDIVGTTPVVGMTLWGHWGESV